MTVQEAIAQAYQNGYEAGKKDVVEVVRCKDCKKFDPNMFENNVGWCFEFQTVLGEMHFCSKGEK